MRFGGADADVLLLATWNDLGAGTGINRNADYFFAGQWQTPDSFMRVVRQRSCSN